MNMNERRKWLVLAVTVAAQFMVIVDVSVVNVALPAIKHDLHFSQDNLQWVITAYAILFGGTLLLGGRLADLLGRRRLFMAGVAVFTVGSLLSGLAWSAGALIVTRALQGLAARCSRRPRSRSSSPRSARGVTATGRSA
jgi:MFS family permease